MSDHKDSIQSDEQAASGLDFQAQASFNSDRASEAKLAELLSSVEAELDSTFVRIREHQAVTRQLRKDTRRGLDQLSKIVANL